MEFTKQKVYKQVLHLASKELLGSDLEERCKAADVTCRVSPQSTVVEVPFFDEVIHLSLPDFTFKSSKNRNITLVTKIVVLHYLNRASGLPTGGEQIGFEDITGLKHYFPVYAQRVIVPLERAFGRDSHAFLQAGLALGAVRQEYGDASFTLTVLPRVPITFILWEADDEFPPSVRALFDPTIDTYLPLEDVAVVAKLATMRILKQARLQHGDEATPDF